MTSPGLKRPLDVELTTHPIKQNDEEGPTSASVVMEKMPILDDIKPCLGKESTDSFSAMEDSEVTIKRRCTDAHPHTSPIPMDHAIDDKKIATADRSNSPSRQQIQLCNQSQPASHSPSSNNISNIDTSLNEEITALIKNELSRSQERNVDTDDRSLDTDEPPILSKRQAHSICEKLVRDVERRLREQYDRKLACKLAEQYDLFAKANYLNTFADSARVSAGIPMQHTPTSIPPTTAPMAAAADYPPIKNAMASAFLQRSTASPIVSPSSTPSPLLSAATSMPNLTSIAASLTANGHPIALTSTHHHHHSTAYNLQQQQAATVAALRHVQQQHHQSHQRRISLPPNGPLPLGPVLLASSLDEQLAVPEALFTLFGVFGDVIRVKILFNKKDNALVQMADANQAQVAQAYLDKQKIFGKVVRVSPSKHQVVQMPRDGNQSDAGLTKDFTNSPLHRFKIPGSRNYSNIYPPSNTLHISNIPAMVDERDLHKAFRQQCGFEFSSFKFFPNKDSTGTAKDRKMALIRFSSIEEATVALIKMHNFQMSEENNLRVSFSKSAL